MGAIDNFRSLINRSGGLARGNKYEVDIYAPNGHPAGTEGRNLNLFCSTITMPGHKLEQQTQRFGTEPATEMVTSHSYAGNIDATFYLDAGLDIKVWFDKWQMLAVNPITHKAKYYDDYKEGYMDIYQLGADGKRTYGVRCEEVYPATIGGIEYSYESTDMIQLLTIEFAYRKWTDIRDLDSGVAYKRTRLPDTTERLTGNGVESSVLTRAEILRKFS